MNERQNPVNYNLVTAHIIAALIFLIMSITAGLLYSLQFLNHYPLQGIEFFSPGRVRMVHTNAVAYGWLLNGLLSGMYWAVPRTSGYPVLSRQLSWLIFWFLQILVLATAVGILGGYAQAIEFGETPIFVDPFITLGLFLLATNFIPPILKSSKDAPLYVSLWYFIGALVWIIMVYIMGNYIPQFFVPGAAGAAITGNYIHDFVGLLITPLGWGLMYFFVPTIIKKPIWSHTLSLMGFWGLAFFYPMQGIHHFMWSPVPMHVQYSAVVASIAIEVVVTSVLANFIMTLKGSGDYLRTNYPIRWFYTGMVFYWVTCFQCAIQSTLTAQKLIHFTDWVVAHAHLVMFGVFSFWLMGIITELWPRLTGKEWYSHSLNGWAYWLCTLGIILMFIDLTIGGVVQGFIWWGLNPFMDSIRFSVPFWFVRTLSGLMISGGIISLIYNLSMTAKNKNLIKPLIH
ncbi:MAG: cbb3-type cytochrome c oxidase subunit I [Nitrospinae bacterium]|nr:cbb3-type cytochrome c oxidase subunit I [Nitrospinota bacterium]